MKYLVPIMVFFVSSTMSPIAQSMYEGPDMIVCGKSLTPAKVSHNKNYDSLWNSTKSQSQNSEHLCDSFMERIRFIGENSWSTDLKANMLAIIKNPVGFVMIRELTALLCDQNRTISFCETSSEENRKAFLATYGYTHPEFDSGFARNGTIGMEKMCVVFNKNADTLDLNNYICVRMSNSEYCRTGIQQLDHTERLFHEFNHARQALIWPNLTSQNKECIMSMLPCSYINFHDDLEFGNQYGIYLIDDRTYCYDPINIENFNNSRGRPSKLFYNIGSMCTKRFSDRKLSKKDNPIAAELVGFHDSYRNTEVQRAWIALLETKK
ncbi:hypothetical protein FACS189449_00570 [Alphaproteobacteria bacterium]|nr:hypothetical protein FACS189449_00570 [Alphaproteobacteria bacterium]